MIRPLKHRIDRNYYLFFDTETSPKYFILEKNQLIENAKIISKKEYESYKSKNEKLRKIKYQIGFYQITKMISIFDMDNNSKCFIVEDEYLQSELEDLITDDYISELYFGDSPEEIIDMFWQTIKKYMFENQYVRVFAHNIGFDLKQIDFFNEINKLEGREMLTAGKSNKIISCCLSKPFFIKARYDYEGVLGFDDSYSFFATSLKNIGKNINIEKLEQKFDGENLIITDDTIKYCVRDTYIIKTAICNLLKYLEDYELGNLGITLSGTAMNIWRTSFLEYPIYNDYPIHIQYIERSCYYGGRNECYKIGLFENMYYYDMNSIYPYVMEINKFPTKYLTTITNEYEEITNKYVEELLENEWTYYIFNCEIETTKNHVPYRSDRLMFVKGKFSGHIHQPEFLYFWNRGEVKNIKDIIVYKADYIFKDYISFFKKEKIKNEDNPIYRQQAKILQNALYGKTAEHFRESIYFDNEIPIIESVDLYDDEDNKIGRRDNFGYFGFLNNEDKNKNAKTAFPAIAGAVTSYARLELIKIIDYMGIENILYCDTDSIMSIKELDKKFLHNYNYGFWKNEAIKLYKENNLPVKQTLNVIIKGCKNYILFSDDKILSIKSKGIKKDSQEIEDNIYSTDKWWTVKTSKVKHESIFTMRHTVVMHEIKQNTLEYMKGKTIFKGRKIKKIGDIKIKYNQYDIKPWKISDLKKLDKEE